MSGNIAITGVPTTPGQGGKPTSLSSLFIVQR